MQPDSTACARTTVIIDKKTFAPRNSRFDTNYLQAITIHVKDENKGTVVSEIYCPPQHKIK